MKSDLSHLDKYVCARGDDGLQALMPYHGVRFNVIASWGGGWDHVSVSLPNRCPTYEEMDWIKRQFFEPDETAMQLHVSEDAHINIHTHCLHLWKPQGADIPTPPLAFV